MVSVHSRYPRERPETVSYTHLVLNKLSPIFVTLLAAVFMKEKLSPIQIPALALSVLGAFIVFRPSFQSDPFPLVVALLSAVTSGVAYTFLGYFKGKVDGITVIIHFSTFSVFGLSLIHIWRKVRSISRGGRTALCIRRGAARRAGDPFWRNYLSSGEIIDVYKRQVTIACGRPWRRERSASID